VELLRSISAMRVGVSAGRRRQTRRECPFGPCDPPSLVENEFCNGANVVSPDGGWIAYHSTLSGQIKS
jgi:hypothetical protein